MFKKSMLLLIMIPSIFADQYNFSNTTSTTTNTPATTAISVDRTYATFSDAITRISANGISCKIAQANQTDPVNQTIKFDGSIQDFINLVAQKFNYSVTIDKNIATFTGMYPPKPKPTPIPQATSTGVDKQIVINNNWTYTPNDKYISTTLSRWANQAGYQLIWRANNDFEVQSSGALTGGFKIAVNEVLKSFKNTEHPLQAQWYKNNVVVITNLGD